MFEVDRTGLDAGGVASAQDAGDCSCFLILLLVFMPRAANDNCFKESEFAFLPRFMTFYTIFKHVPVLRLKLNLFYHTY